MIHEKPIPGETPLDDISGLRIKSIRSRAALNDAEADNIRRAIVKYLAAKPTRRQAAFDLPFFQKLHREMFGRVWTWAGTFRTRPVNIGLPAFQIQLALQNLADDLEHWQKGTNFPLIEQSAMLHHRAVAIHPFLNGNGRWARLLANIWLRRHDHPLVQWPEQTIGRESAIRQQYLAAVRCADAGDYGPLFAVHRDHL